MAKRSGLAWKVCYAVLIPGLMLGLLSCGGDNTPTPAGSVTPTEQATPTGGLVVTPIVNQGISATETVTAATTVAPTAATATTAAATASPAPGTNSVVVPNYSNFKPAAVGAPLEARLGSQLLGSITSPGTIQFFTTDSNFSEVVKYYDKVLGDAGYTKAGSQPVSTIGTLNVKDGEIVGYTVGGSNPNRVALVNLGIITDNFISQLNSAELTALKLNVGDHLVALINNVPPGLG